MQGKGWRRCLFVFLLAASLADVSGDLNDDNPSADSKSGNPNDDVDFDNSNGSRVEDGEVDAFVDSLANIGIPGYPDDEDRLRRNQFEPFQSKLDGIHEHDPTYIMQKSHTSILPGPSVNSQGYKFSVPQVDVNEAGPTQYYGHSDGIHARQNWKDELNPFYDGEISGGQGVQFPEPSVNFQGYRFPQSDVNAANPTYEYRDHFDHLDDHEDGSLIKDQFIKSSVREGPLVHDEIVLPKNLTYETVVLDNEYPYNLRNSSSGLRSSIHKHHEFFSKLIPFEKHILLNKIPGAENIIKCTKEGEIHNFWASGIQCMVCVCLAAYGRLRPVCVSCQSCLTPPEPTTYRPIVPPYTPHSTPPPVPDNVSCKPLPVNVQFPSPIDPCKVCVCTETLNQWGKMDVRIHCQHNPQCVLPTTPPTHVTTPVPLPLCDKLPPNVPFPHPQDSCKICQCVVNQTPYGQIEQQIDCYTSPECQPITSTQPPGPDIIDLPPLEICDRYPENVLFPHPRDQCQVCKCTVHSGPFSDRKKISCYVRPDCLPPPPTTELPPNLEPLHLCEKHLDNVIFPDPLDQCKLCKCHTDPRYGYKRMITCFLRPECALPPPPEPEPEIDDVCGRYPVNTPFDDPNDQCRTCTCTQIGSAAPGVGLQNSPFRPQLQILCQIKPECLLSPPPSTTEYPDDDVCGRYPIDTPFEDPNDQCRTCTCTYQQIDSAPPGALQSSFFPTRAPPQLQILCQIKPECIPTPPPITENPEPYSFCENYPVEVPFTDPLDPCRSCVCFWNSAGAAADEVFGHAPPTRVKLSKCVLKPECVSCKPLPSGKPFQSPLNPCQICTCTEIFDAYGRPDAVFKCQQNPQCVVPDDVTTVPPDSYTSPVPLPACARLPTDVEFPHPSDPCKLCKCTVQRTPWGKLDQYINCFNNPQCAIATTTLAPWPPAPPGPLPGPSPHESCTPYIPNQPFQHPWDECQTCVCKEAITLERITIEVNCYTKPSCCYEPPIDIPGLPDGGVIDIESRPLIDGGSSNWLNPVSESINQILNWKHANENEIGTVGGNLIGTAGGNLRPAGGNVIHSSGGNVIETSDSNLYRPVGIPTYNHNVIDLNGGSDTDIGSENWIADQGKIQIGYKDNLIRQSANLIGPTGGNYIGPSGSNIIGSAGENWIKSTGSNVIGSTGGNIIGPTGSNVIGPTGGNVIGPAGGNLIGPNTGKLNGPNGGNLYVPNDENLYGPNGGNLYGANGAYGPTGTNSLQTLLNLNGNIDVPNRGNLLLRPIGDVPEQGLWREPFHYNLRPEEASEARAEAEASYNSLNSDAAAFAVVHRGYSNKIRTRSGRPGDNDNEDYE